MFFFSDNNRDKGSKMLLQPKNWAQFQHYRNRCPPWIKLHRDLLNNRDFIRLPIASKALAPLLWLLASEAKDGVFDASLDELMFRLHITEKEYRDGLKPLIDKGFFLSDSSMLASCLQLATSEGEGEGEGEGETYKKPQDKPADLLFDDFWKAYPKKQGKDLAKTSFAKRKVGKELLQQMLSSIDQQKATDQWKKDGGQFIPAPATWLNQGRWQDEVTSVHQSTLPKCL